MKHARIRGVITLGTALGAALAAVLASNMAGAQTYPAKSVRVMVGYAPGGISDIVVRVAVEEMGKRLGQPLVVENRPGAAASIAANIAKTATPDGYTLYGGAVTTFLPIFLKTNSVDASKDLAPISMLGMGDWFMYVPSSLPIKDLKDLVAYSKTTPLRFAAPASSNTMLMALVAKRLGFRYENIPYKTTDQTITSMLNGDTQVSLNAAAGFGSFLSSGRLRAITSLSAKRLDLMPDLPTAIEQGVQLEAYSQQTLWAPLGTSPEIINRLHAAAVEALKSPGVVEKFRNVSYTAISSTPAELIRRSDDTAKLLMEAVEILGLKPE